MISLMCTCYDGYALNRCKFERDVDIVLRSGQLKFLPRVTLEHSLSNAGGAFGVILHVVAFLLYSFIKDEYMDELQTTIHALMA